MIKSAYIHIPFCKRICSYCDFCKIIYNKKWIMEYLYSLEYEIKSKYNNDILNTLYIGGGTPSSLDIDELNYLFNILKIFKLNNNYEFTIECNIEDITEEKLKLFKKNKINRLSIGIQTFNDKYLKFLNRNYNSNIIFDKIKLAKKYFENINVDLMYAFKDENLEELKKDIENILLLDVTHVSCYSLIIEKNTKLYIDGEKEIDSDLDYEMYNLIDKLFNNKYKRYEISNYSKEGYESRHNTNYWLNNEYYGFGLGAAKYINKKRITNTKNLTKYLKHDYENEIEILSDDDKIKYELILGFRLIKGINIDNFYNKYKRNILDIHNIKQLIDKNYLILDNGYIYVNKKYLYVINDILINFV